MPAPARSDAIIADFRRAVTALIDLNDEAATRLADTLSRWLAGEPFEAAAGLYPGWRRYQRDRVRDAALRELITLHPNLDDLGLARRISAGLAALERVASTNCRPDGECGIIWDLAAADCARSIERIRKLIAAHRPVVIEIGAATTTLRDLAACTAEGNAHDGRKIEIGQADRKN